MKNILLTFLMLFCLTIAFSFALYLEKKSNNKQLNHLKVENENLSAVFQELLIIREKEQKILSYDLSNTIVITESKEKKSLANLPIKRKLGIYIDNNMCSLCIDKIMDKIKKYNSIIGNENIFIIGAGYQNKYFFEGSSFKNLGSLYLSIENLFPNIEKETPICFFMDNNNKILYSYIEAKTWN